MVSTTYDVSRRQPLGTMERVPLGLITSSLGTRRHTGDGLHYSLEHQTEEAMELAEQ